MCCSHIHIKLLNLVKYEVCSRSHVLNVYLKIWFPNCFLILGKVGCLHKMCYAYFTKCKANLCHLYSCTDFYSRYRRKHKKWIRKTISQNVCGFSSERATRFFRRLFFDKRNLRRTFKGVRCCRSAEVLHARRRKFFIYFLQITMNFLFSGLKSVLHFIMFWVFLPSNDMWILSSVMVKLLLKGCWFQHTYCVAWTLNSTFASACFFGSFFRQFLMLLFCFLFHFDSSWSVVFFQRLTFKWSHF